MAEIRGGKMAILVDGDRLDAKGNFTYNLGEPVREAIVGPDSVHGYKEMPQVPFIEGAITDRADLDLRAALYGKTDATIILEKANGKQVVLRNAWFAGEGSGTTEEGELAVRFEGLAAEEV